MLIYVVEGLVTTIPKLKMNSKPQTMSSFDVGGSDSSSVGFNRPGPGCVRHAASGGPAGKALRDEARYSLPAGLGLHCWKPPE